MPVLLEIDKKLTTWLYLGDAFSGAADLVVFILASMIIYALPVVLLILFWRNRSNERQASLSVLVAALFSWLILANLTGYIAYEIYGFRERPFVDFGLNELFFERPQKAFPSDHAAVFAAAAAMFFATRLKTWGWFFVISGFLSCLARVSIGFHWVGDIIAGWLIGLIGFAIVYYLSPQLNRLFLRSKFTDDI